MRIVLLLILTFSTVVGISQIVTINGNASTYPGEEFVFYTYNDLITLNEIELGRCRVEENGDFKCEFQIDVTTEIFIYLEVFKAFMFIEPDASYQVELPPKTLKDREDRKNPFFKPSDVNVRIIGNNENELNYLIRSFDASYNAFLVKFYKELTSLSFRREIDSLIVKFNQYYPDSVNPYFTNYKEYKLLMLKQLAYNQSAVFAAKEYFSNKPIQYSNVAYMELFNQVFDNHFATYIKTDEGVKIKSNVNLSKSFRKLMETLSGNLALQNDTLREIVAIKGLYDAFYSNDFSRRSIIQTLDSAYLYSDIELHKIIIDHIKKDVKSLMTGTKAPEFSLYDLDSNLVSLADCQGYFVYLNFSNTGSPIVKRDYNIMDSLYKEFQDSLVIISIITDNNISRAKIYISDKDYKWKFLHYGNQKDVINSYRVKVLPTYFFIDPKGNLMSRFALPPTENFRKKYGMYINSIRDKNRAPIDDQHIFE